MIEINNIQVYGFEGAIRGMRNPMNSWSESDSFFLHGDPSFQKQYIVNCELGEKDLALAQKLVLAGTDHSKFTRMINATMDITTNHIWWSEFDTYKVSTVRNSCSKMHKIHVKEFKVEDFSHEGITEVGDFIEIHFKKTIEVLEYLRKEFNKTKERKYWRALIELLPMGYNLKATVQLNYQTLRNMYFARQHHKLQEWKDFCKIIEELPYGKELICLKEK